MSVAEGKQHTTEPWARIGNAIHKDGVMVPLKAPANVARILACVNACAGMADPEAEIAALKEVSKEVSTALGDAEAEIAALREVAEESRSALRSLEVAVEIGGGDPSTHIRCCALRAALAKLEAMS